MIYLKFFVRIQTLGLVFCLCFICVKSEAQLRQAPNSQRIDSLEKELERFIEPTPDRSRTLIAYAWAYVGVDPEVSIASFTEALTIAEKNENWKNVGRIYNMRAYIKEGYMGIEAAIQDKKAALWIWKKHGFGYLTNGQYVGLFSVMVNLNRKDEAWRYADTIKELVHQSKSPRRYASYEFSMGYAYNKFGQTDSAINRFQNGLIQANLAPDTLDVSYEKILLLSNLANVYIGRSAEQLALEYLLKALDVIKKNPEQGQLLNGINTSINVLYINLGQTQKALDLLLVQKEDLLARNNLTSLATCYLNISICYQNLDLYDSASSYLMLAKDILILRNDGKRLIRVNSNLSSIAYQQGEFDKALEYDLKVIEEADSSSYLFARSFYQMGMTYYKMGNSKDAEKYLLQCVDISDAGNFPKLLGKSYAALSDHYNSQGDYGLGLKAYKKYKYIDDSINTVTANNRFNELILKYEAEKKEVEIRSQRNLLVKSRESLKSEKKFQSGLLAGFGLIGLVGFFSIFNHRSRQKSLREILRQNEKLSKAELKKEISDLKLRALQAQMNPGFLFETIDVIQKHINSNDDSMAYDLLSKFSNLIHYILECTKKDYVGLKDEIDFLDLYVETEKIKYGTHFDVEIEGIDGTQFEYIEIPPMEIQPHLWNWIRHLKDPTNGDSKINLSFQGSDGKLTCIISLKDLIPEAVDSFRKKLELEKNGLISKELVANTYPIDTGIKVVPFKQIDDDTVGTLIQFPLTSNLN